MFTFKGALQFVNFRDKFLTPAFKVEGLDFYLYLPEHATITLNRPHANTVKIIKSYFPVITNNERQFEWCPMGFDKEAFFKLVRDAAVCQLSVEELPNFIHKDNQTHHIEQSELSALTLSINQPNS